MIDCKDMSREEFIHQQVMKILNEHMEFSNVARPKPTKASASASSTGNLVEEPKASAATQGSWDSTNTPGGVSALAKEKWNVHDIAAIVTKVLKQNEVAFSNKPVPKPTKASASASSTGNLVEEPKASAATQGAWDTTGSPGGVSDEAKKAWTIHEVAAMVTEVLKQSEIAFANKPLPKPTTVSSSTQPAWKTGEPEVAKPSASTQAVWKKDEPRKPSASTQAGWK